MKRVLQPRFLLIALLLCAIFFAYPDSALTKAEELSSSANDAITVEIVDDNDSPENPPDNTPENTPPLNNDQEPELNLNITENPVKKPTSPEEYRERRSQLIERRKERANQNIDAAFSATESTEEVIEIWTAEDLYNVRYNLSGHYIQMADIDLSEYENWEPICTEPNPFTGSYDFHGYIVANLTINRPDTDHVGLFGYTSGDSERVRLDNARLVDVDIVGGYFVGALVGEGYYTTIDMSFSSGKIVGEGAIGGLVGYVWDAECEEAGVTNSYSTCSVTATNDNDGTGGLIGLNGLNVVNCYAIGAVNGSDYCGGLIGTDAFGIQPGSYYNSQTSGQFDADKGTPKTTLEMGMQETYIDWDFENIWGIDPNENDGYPYLRAGGKVISKDLLGLRPFCGYNGLVNLSTGNFIQQNTDIAIPLPGPGLRFTRFYNSQDDYTGPLGKGWTHNYNVHLAVNPDGSIAVSYADGHVYVFTLDGSDYSPPPGCYEELALGPDDGYTLTFKDHSAYIFNASGQLESITDQNGNSLEFTYSSDLLTTVNDPGSGQTLSLDYDSENHLTEITDLMSRSVAYGYTDGNLTTVQDLNGGLTQYGYDAHGLTTITLPEGNTVLTNSYDDSSRVLEQSDALTNSWQYAYSDSQTTITGPENDVTGYGYDDHFCGISVTDPQGAETVYGYDQNYNCTSIIDAYENEQTFAYDDRGNLTSATNVFGTTEYEYDSNDNLITITDPEEKETSFTFDSNHNLTSITDPDDAVTSFTYYADGQIHTRTNPETDAGTGTVTYTYDDGFPDTITDPLGNTTTLSYDLAGRLLSITNDLGKTTAYSYDDAGNLLSVTDPLQNSINLEYNGNNQIIAFTDANQNVTTYGYDDNNNLINVTDALNQTTAYAYDSNNRLASVTDARNNTTTYGYDSNGRLTAITDALGHTISYDYDDVGNITQITNALQNPVYSYEYDPVTYLMESVKDALNNTNTLQYDTMGRLTQHTNPLQHSSQFDYDNVNRHNQTTDAIQGVASQGFDALGARINLTDSNNNERDYSFDLLGRLTSRSTATGTVEYAYNEIGQLSTFTNGRDQNRTWQYDDAGRPISMTDPDGTITYTYDGNGNLLTVTDTQGTITRQYDALNRVTS
ncbi:MAG TPA: hypothetical protein DER60_04075, partial [Syntrophomonas sp.]|nr:hypothetical protein [Syntrophomonas sp.]